jgi:hypothetical protein
LFANRTIVPRWRRRYWYVFRGDHIGFFCRRVGYEFYSIITLLLYDDVNAFARRRVSLFWRRRTEPNDTKLCQKNKGLSLSLSLSLLFLSLVIATNCTPNLLFYSFLLK